MAMRHILTPTEPMIKLSGKILKGSIASIVFNVINWYYWDRLKDSNNNIEFNTKAFREIEEKVIELINEDTMRTQ